MLIVDASVAVKWVLDETGSDRALALVTSQQTMAAPSLVIEEVGNVAWKRVRRRLATPSEAHEMVFLAIGMLSLVVPAEELWEEALKLAVELNHPIYDCFYLALAQREGAPFVTADARLARLAGEIGISLEPL